MTSEMVTAVDFGIISNQETIGWQIFVVYLYPFSAEDWSTTEVSALVF